MEPRDVNTGKWFQCGHGICLGVCRGKGIFAKCFRILLLKRKWFQLLNLNDLLSTKIRFYDLELDLVVHWVVDLAFVVIFILFKYFFIKYFCFSIFCINCCSCCFHLLSLWILCVYWVENYAWLDINNTESTEYSHLKNYDVVSFRSLRFVQNKHSNTVLHSRGIDTTYTYYFLICMLLLSFYVYFCSWCCCFCYYCRCLSHLLFLFLKAIFLGCVCWTMNTTETFVDFLASSVKWRPTWLVCRRICVTTWFCKVNGLHGSIDHF